MSSSEGKRGYGEEARRTSLLMSVLDLEKPVRDMCRIVQRIAAMVTSPAAANALMLIDKPYE